ncbi:MAG: OstA-like protein [Bacteroidota bacterium]
MTNFESRLDCFNWISLFGFLLLLISSSHLSFAQTTTEPSISTASQQDSTNKKVTIDFADTLNLIQENGEVIQKLLGNVELRQDSVYMYCDSAVIRDRNKVVAQGNVITQQGDSLSVFSDSLNYNGDTRQATLFSKVVLDSKGQQLFTEQLDYDLNTKIATYFTGALLTNGTTQLTSKRGYFYTEVDEVYFKDSVVVIDPEFNLLSDTLKFNTATQTAFFLGPTLIKSDTTQIYCEDGFYDTENEAAEFRQNAQFVKGEQIAVGEIIRYEGETEIYSIIGQASFTENDREAIADTIKYNDQTGETFLFGDAVYQDSTQYIAADEITYNSKKEIYKTKGRSYISDPPQILQANAVDYDNETGLGIAIGDVIWQDTSQQLTILCELARYNQNTDYLKASGGRPMMITKIEEDSLYLASDTLVATSLQDTVIVDSITTRIDTSRFLNAYPDVRIYKSDMQALCDSLTYSTRDSMFRFFENPIIWADTSQFTADTIHMSLKNDQIHKIFLYIKSFIVNSPDELFFNQIKGKNTIATFQEGDLRRMDVKGNAESVYYALDEQDAYVGVNKTICSNMVLLFGNNEIEKIKFFKQPTARLEPMEGTDHDALKLEGFRWVTEGRPQSVEDILEIRIDETVLKPAKLQALEEEGLEEDVSIEKARLGVEKETVLEEEKEKEER